MITAELHRPNLGSAAYLWIGGRERLYATTSEAHAAMNRRGTVVFVERIVSGDSSVERYIIEKRSAQ